jgi:putative toxin-antitoxin system antitoxin component (TIGR02293 family)
VEARRAHDLDGVIPWENRTLGTAPFAPPPDRRHLTKRHLSHILGQMAIALFKTYPLENNLKMAELVAVGLPSLALKQVAAALGLQPAKVSPMVNITKKTMERRLKDKAKLKPDESERVARLMRVIARATDVLEDEGNARQWLNRPLKVLGGLTPLALSATEPGAREVEQVLGRLEQGVFA